MARRGVPAAPAPALRQPGTHTPTPDTHARELRLTLGEKWGQRAKIPVTQGLTPARGATHNKEVHVSALQLLLNSWEVPAGGEADK